MSRITHTNIIITKNPLLKVPVVVPQWEAHVLLALWGDDAQVTGTTVIDRDVPEANDEFTRLANKYGPRDEDIPFVARVYGSFGPGLRGLRAEFDSSIAGSNATSVVDIEPEVLEIDREKFEEGIAIAAAAKVAPEVLAGFNGSKAPTAPADLTAKPEQVIVSAPLVLEGEGTPVEALAVELQTLATEDGLPRVEAEDAAVLTTEQADEVDTFAGNTVGGIPLDAYLKSDVSDLTGEGSGAA